MFAAAHTILGRSPTLRDQQPRLRSFDIENISWLDGAQIDPVDHLGELLDQTDPHPID